MTQMKLIETDDIYKLSSRILIKNKSQSVRLKTAGIAPKIRRSGFKNE